MAPRNSDLIMLEGWAELRSGFRWVQLTPPLWWLTKSYHAGDRTTFYVRPPTPGKKIEGGLSRIHPERVQLRALSALILYHRKLSLFSTGFVVRDPLTRTIPARSISARSAVLPTALASLPASSFP